MRNHSISNKLAFALRLAIGNNNNKLLIEIRLFYSVTKVLLLFLDEKSSGFRACAAVVVFECNGRIFIGIITRLPEQFKGKYNAFYFAKLFFLNNSLMRIARILIQFEHRNSTAIWKIFDIQFSDIIFQSLSLIVRYMKPNEIAVMRTLYIWSVRSACCWTFTAKMDNMRIVLKSNLFLPGGYHSRSFQMIHIFFSSLPIVCRYFHVA